MTQVDTLREILNRNAGTVVPSGQLRSALGDITPDHLAVLARRLRQSGMAIGNLCGGYITGEGVDPAARPRGVGCVLSATELADVRAFQKKCGATVAEALVAVGRADILGGAA